MGNAFRIVGPPRWEKGALLWKSGGPVYEIRGKVVGEDRWIITETGRAEAVIVGTVSAEEAGYVEVRRA